jgi:hypothetical protein
MQPRVFSRVKEQCRQALRHYTLGPPARQAATQRIIPQIINTISTHVFLTVDNEECPDGEGN